MNNLISRDETLKQIDTLFDTLDTLELTMAKKVQDEKEYIENEIKKRIEQLHETIDDMERIMKEESLQRKKPLKVYAQAALSS
ncbi:MULTISPECIES: hypothetical protein [Bacillus]|uniref:hypothetical protein n=1 Tax=Bacillus TaxID=1386 RepID=UPI000BB968AF|nr:MULTISPECIES: hypothetical protein [Bacillus]